MRARRRNDAGEFGELRRAALLERPATDALDRLSRLGSRALEAPIALVSVVGETHELLRGCVGMPEPWASLRGIPLRYSFSRHVVSSGELLVIEDAREHSLVSENPAIEELGVIAYAGVPLVSSNGDVLGAFCVMDRRGRVWPEPEIDLLRELAAVAATEIGLRTQVVELSRRAREEELLRQSQKMEAISRLAAGIAHDFNNILNVIGGNAEMLLADVVSGNCRKEDVQEIVDSADRAAGLTRQLLAFSRKQVLRVQFLDLNEVVGKLQHVLRRLVGDDVEVVTSVGPHLWRVRADPGQIEQVLMNLAVNARDAMPAGGRLTIETRNMELDEEAVRGGLDLDPGDHVLLTVSDTGTGMPPEVIERIFEPFFTTKEKGKGTGLGLSTVYGIIKQSGGCVRVESAPGHGARFSIYLPREDDPDHAPSSELRERPAEVEAVVLLVEDDLSVRRTARRALERSGYTVWEAGNGQEALRLTHGCETPIRLTITGVSLRGMKGPELMDHLRALRPGMPVLFTSGGEMDDAVALRLRGGGAGFLSKPFTPDELTYKAREVLDIR